ncbi:MerR family transcriptional regulator [Microbulbifer harenosus]|uniref:MerR family transcriptional regulator n=1 Tax=Microbulbifer harenosus TaxID=2576840 RepID=A0ABY2UEH0_9GAMM|nr:MerR family transcriptional regulator [Microbulbifer harenosus]TLM75649.1 MerR family transcriptional regulator [Microbulbifer harenosus]
MTIKEFSSRTGISAHTLRYYEKIGLLRHIRRLPNGHRDFSEKDIQWIAFVQRLKDTDMPLEQIRRYADLREAGDTTLAERQQLLENHARGLRESLAQQQRHLDKLNEKIALYRSAVKRGRLS